MPEYKPQEDIEFSFVKEVKYVFPLGLYKEEILEDYGRFVFSPLERGYGHTIGNVLRRVLLSSIPGYALVGVKIDGVAHEFSAIEGVLEDVTQIVLNLKKVRIKFDPEIENKAILRLTATEKRDYKAKDIKFPSFVTVVNPEQHLFTVTGEDVVVNMELVAVRGRGYVPAEEIQLEDLPVGYIMMDGLFSPVKKVNFTVENVRVKARTDFEKMVLEIWTDETASPDAVLKYAVDLLLDVLSRFHKEAEMFREIRPIVDYERKLRIRDLLEKDIDELELPRRLLNVLKDEGITKIKELITLRKEDVLKLRNLGDKSFKEIEERLEPLGLTFGMNLKDFED
ncbi:MAG TPA: DNA-directed RNA polymerase subunit alpha [Candidatus Hydrothermia bacterium]|nr:DNA-directed RNA polymerase subunit alpha [Candidatus Hydrothermae bacterium]MDD3648952.1 DNA-directed RNA polymerase subunit alpha [Candidatus Hydrothermia bacterium]MDD5573181.1 DNA-directed RNA polymerase subunit alpha [Candidatus Hydrothermia bacterium]HOK23193.1 DNA-directed RNA polymerase subunit alpha [Candidatus Hydrothermia bacterium]HOL23897.1 DNA-directed RNA polymerase subunit alpha [Candidatus Hydrothermia bacterium]